MTNNLWPFATPGIPDELFIRGKIPMTKEEIRVLTLAKARPGPNIVFWDIGAGTGSLSVEAARLSPGGTVFAVEKDPGGLELVVKNSRRFRLENIVPVAGEAPDSLKDLPSPHRVLIGGSGGRLEEIIIHSMSRLRPGGRIVINTVTLETAAKVVECCKGWRYEAVQVQVSRAAPAGGVHLWRAMNPVCIFTLVRESS